MENKDDKPLSNEDSKEYISKQIKKLSQRELYVLLSEISKDYSWISPYQSLDIINKQICHLGIDDINYYIDLAYAKVVADEIISWITKSLRATLWFDNYISSFHSDTDYNVLFEDIISTSYSEDCIKQLDTCSIIQFRSKNLMRNNLHLEDSTQNRRVNRRHETDDSLLRQSRSGDSRVQNRISRTRTDEVRGPRRKRLRIEVPNYNNKRINLNLPLRKESERRTRSLEDFGEVISTSRNRNDLENKTRYINQAKKYYYQYQTPFKQLEWLDQKDEQQLLWAQEYLCLQGLLLQPELFSAETSSDLYDQICASLDVIDNAVRFERRVVRNSEGMSLYKKEIIRKMRNAWSQKKFRDKKDAETAQEHFLTRRHINKLKKLASEYGVSSKEYLQKLIDEAYDSTD